MHEFSSFGEAFVCALDVRNVAEDSLFFGHVVFYFGGVGPPVSGLGESLISRDNVDEIRNVRNSGFGELGH